MVEAETWRVAYLQGVTYRGYEVSNLGRVRNSRGNQLVLIPNGQGYRVVTLRLDKVHKQIRVHRLVLASSCGRRLGEQFLR